MAEYKNLDYTLVFQGEEVEYHREYTIWEVALEVFEMVVSEMVDTVEVGMVKVDMVEVETEEKEFQGTNMESLGLYSDSLVIQMEFAPEESRNDF